MQTKHGVRDYLTKTEEEQAKKAFRIFDQDGSGAISIREFDQILKSLGQSLTQEQLNKLVKTIDKDGNGLIQFNEFLQLVAPKIIQSRSVKAYIEAFKIMDENNEGILDKDKLQKANQITKAGLSEQQIDSILNYVQMNFGGKLNVINALSMLLRTPTI